MENGDTKDDLNLPDQQEDDKKLCEEIIAKFNEGVDFTVTVQAACGQEKIIGTNQLQAPK